MPWKFEPGDQAGDPNENIVPQGKRPCPICGQVMHVEQNRGVSIDVCTAHGVWLDNGELQEITGRIARSYRRINDTAVKDARQKGKMSGALFGFWSLLGD